MGPQANVLHSAVRISSLTILNFRFMLMSIFNSTVQSQPVLAITCDKPAVQTLESPSDKSDTGLCSVREFGYVCVPPKTKKKERKSSVENAT
jgi:hypothetical protein